MRQSHFLHSVFISLFSLLLAIFILASYLSYGNTPNLLYYWCNNKVAFNQ
ncbi:hypothetical protein Bandiella_00592 [Candidatus Bandiella woodruffii]|uniref:Uncharacterized protein n=1 Tax=Candidatus Bandiella euplotis TaxID=1664265 RepID=A0ABZ0UK52_9RICK|nr:hypothetical protein Bandiella_00592 [Candidatus Bandiella woodruffii]